MNPLAGPHIDETTALATGAPRRHPSLDRLCADLHAMSVGERAAALLSDPARLRDAHAVWVPPAWAWTLSALDLGRRDRDDRGTVMNRATHLAARGRVDRHAAVRRSTSRDLPSAPVPRPRAPQSGSDDDLGSGNDSAQTARYLMPVRVQFSEEPVVLLGTGRASRRELTWSAAGLGRSGTGMTVVAITPDGFLEETNDSSLWSMPREVRLIMLDPAQVQAVLSDLVAIGHDAKWSLLTRMERQVRQIVASAHTSISIELSPLLGETTTLIDETKADQIADFMLFGDAEHPGHVMPLLQRCMNSGMFLRTEPMKYVRDSLRRDANALIRRSIGDPHVGPKIRKVALEMASADIEALLKEYRRRYPRDRVSRDRALAALSVSPDAMASWGPLADSPDLPAVSASDSALGSQQPNGQDDGRRGSADAG